MASQLIPMAERLLERSQQARNKSYQVEALLRLGRGLNMANDPRAFASLAQARDLAAQTQDEQLPEILLRMGTCVGWQGDWTQALLLLAEAEAVSNQFGAQRFKVGILIATGVGQMSTGNFGASMDTYRQAVAEAEAGGDQRALATILGNLANNYLCLYLPEPSRESLRRAQAHWDGAGIVNLNCLHNIGWMHHQLGEHDTARACLENVARLARERNHMEQLREIYPTLCAVLLALGERNQALELAQEFCANPGAQYGADDYLPPFTRGGVWLALGRLPEAEADLLLAVQRWERTRIDAQLWEVLISLGKLRIAQGDLEAARGVTARARELIIQIAHSLDNLPDIRDEFLGAVFPLLELNG